MNSVTISESNLNLSLALSYMIVPPIAGYRFVMAEHIIINVPISDASFEQAICMLSICNYTSLPQPSQRVP